MDDKNLKERLELGSVRYQNMPLSGKRQENLRKILGLEGPIPVEYADALREVELELLLRSALSTSTPPTDTTAGKKT